MKSITTSFLISLFALVAQDAFAHTTIVDAGMEGTNLYTNMSIPHGCGAEGIEGNLPVKAQSALFPNFPIAITTRDDTHDPISMSTVIMGATGGLGVFSVRFIQDKNVFKKTKVIRTPDETIIGVRYTKGSLDTDLTGLLPFRATLGRFVPASCAKKVTVYIPIANYCDKGTGPDRADIWMGKLTPVFNDPAIVSLDFWPRLVINRDPENNPLSAACGEGFDVTLEPPPELIDVILPIGGYNPSLP